MTDSRGFESLSLTLVGMAVKTDKIGTVALATEQTLFIRLHDRDIAHMQDEVLRQGKRFRFCPWCGEALK